MIRETIDLSENNTRKEKRSNVRKPRRVDSHHDMLLSIGPFDKSGFRAGGVPEKKI